MHRTRLTFILALLPLLATVAATPNHDPPHIRHRRLAQSKLVRRAPPSEGRAARDATANAAHANARRVIRRQITKRGEQCRAKAASAVTSTAASTASTSAPASASTSTSSTTSSSAAAESTSAAAESTSTADATAVAEAAVPSDPTTSTTKSKPKSTPAPSSTPTDSWSDSSASASSSGGVSLSVSGLLSISSSSCGPCPSTEQEPNGAEWWINCGVDDKGWNPPHVTIDQVITKELDTSGVFAPCADYVDLFNSIGDKYNVPGIMLASFAMQESTCNAGATGQNGEAGLMQISPPNCPSSGNCWDPSTNIERGAQILTGYLEQNNGDLFRSMGMYNGWTAGMTVSDAEAAAAQGNCYAQNNLDYIYQLANGWWQGKNGYEIGSYNNLAKCG